MSPRVTAPAALLALAALAPTAPAAFALPPGWEAQVVHSGVATPAAIRMAPDGRLFWLERASGRVMVSTYGGRGTPYVWTTLPVDAQDERGLLGLAFHPQFPDTPYVYLYHTLPSPLVNRVVRVRDVVGLGVGPQVIVGDLPAYGRYHHGGRITFGPDGMMYVTYGDQTDPDHAMNPADRRGKILRYTPLGVPAPGNPFGAGNPAYVMGVRNPFGLAFDPLTGHGWFTENGPSCDDELNFLVAGADYGWRQADACGSQPAGTRAAMRTFTPTIAPTGCVVYRSPLEPAYDGQLFFGTWNQQRVYRMQTMTGDPATLRTLEAFADFDEPVLDVTMGLGHLWVATTTKIHKLVPTHTSDVPTPRWAANFHARPNPFRGTVTFALPAEESFVRLEVMDLAGRRIREWSGPLSGAIVWDGRGDDGPVPAGVYFVRLAARDGAAIRRIVRLER
jgi:glucose/arabinose dehydrogenase